MAIIYYKNHFIHRPDISSPENPQRVKQVIGYLQGRTDIFEGKALLKTMYPQATHQDLERVHDREYVEFVENYSNKGGGFLGDSTYFSKNTFKAAAMSAGGAKEAARVVYEKEFENAMALIRPPGHHASQNRFGGYCIFNNAAVAARYIQSIGAKKVMLVDWDVHAGNGTMHIFYEDPTVLNLSIHRDPNEFYPHDGFAHQIGRGEGRGCTVNVEMPPGSGDEAYREVFKRVVLPLMKQFNPDLVLGLNGFDAHYSDPVAKLSLTIRGYYEIAEFLARSGYPFAILLEGGYTINNGPLTHALIQGILGEELSYPVKLDPLSSSVMSPERVFTILNQKIKTLAENLSDFWDLE